MRVSLAALVLLAACSSPAPAPVAEPTSSTPGVPSSGPGVPSSPAAAQPGGAPTTKPPPPDPRVLDTEAADPRWRFFTRDRHRYRSPWFAGRHRIMIGFGCTRAPYYDPDHRCPGQQGFHHGIDIAMPCGTPLIAGATGRVVGRETPGAPGAAYGPDAFRIRSGAQDLLIGHVGRVFVSAGQQIRVGQRIALAGDAGAPDGCHLHFEARPAGRGYSAAVDPAGWLRLHS